MNKSERDYFEGDSTYEALSRFKRSLISGKKSYFDVSEFEDIVDSLLDEGDLNSSEIAVRQGMQIHPGAVPLQLKYAQVLLSKGKYRNAIEYLVLAEHVEPDNPDVHLMKGSAFLLTGNDYEAEKSFRKALKYSANDRDEILYNIGLSYVQADDIKTGIGYFEESLQFNPKNEMVLYDLGFFCDQEGDFQKSIDYYNRYLDIDPFNFSIWFNMGITYNKIGEYDKAIEAYEFALAINQDFKQALFNIGNAYANIGIYGKAIAKYSEYLESEPENDDAWCYIGECYLNLDDFEQAEYFYKKAIGLNSENDSALFGIGMVKWLNKRFTESIRLIKKAIEIDNLNPEYWLTLAKVYNDFNKRIKAREALKKATELDGDKVEIALVSVDIFLNSGDMNSALSELVSKISENDDPILKYKLVSLFLESNQEKKAVKILKEAMEQEFIHINFLFDIYPKALENERVTKVIDDFRDNFLFKGNKSS